MFGAHSGGVSSKIGRIPHVTVYVENPTEEQQRQADSLGITLVKQPPPLRTTELRGLCETLVGPSSPLSFETKHLGTLGAVVLHNGQRKYLTAAHVVMNKDHISVRIRREEAFEDVEMVFPLPLQRYQKQQGEAYLDVALGTFKSSVDSLVERGSISRLNFNALETFVDHSSQSSSSSRSSTELDDDKNVCDPLSLNYAYLHSPLVYLFGSVSWLSVGKLVARNHSSPVGLRVLLIESIGDQPFAVEGDSGSLIFTTCGGRVVPLGILAERVDDQSSFFYGVRLDVWVKECFPSDELVFIRGDHDEDYGLL